LLVRGFSAGVVWAMNLAVVAILVAFAYFMRWTGTEFNIGLIVGFLICYVLFRCWRFDYDTTGQTGTHQQPLPPRSSDRTLER
jgi:hypothetical protein